MQVGDNGCSWSPTSSDDPLMSHKLAEVMAKLQEDWAQQLAQKQQEVEMWEDESIEVTNSLEQTQDQLEEAMKREQGLQTRLTSLQNYLDSHAHLLSVPYSPLVSPCSLITAPLPQHTPHVACCSNFYMSPVIDCALTLLLGHGAAHLA